MLMGPAAFALNLNLNPGLDCKEQIPENSPATLLDELGFRYLVESPGRFRQAAGYFLDRQPSELSRAHLGTLENILERPSLYFQFRAVTDGDRASGIIPKDIFIRNAQTFRVRIAQIRELLKEVPPEGCTYEKWIQAVGAFILRDWDGKVFFGEILNQLSTKELRYLIGNEKSWQEKEPENSPEKVRKPRRTRRSSADEHSMNPLLDEETILGFHASAWTMAKIIQSPVIYFHFSAVRELEDRKGLANLNASEAALEAAEHATRVYREGLNYLAKVWAKDAENISEYRSHHANFFLSLRSYLRDIELCFVKNKFNSIQHRKLSGTLTKLRPMLEKYFTENPSESELGFKSDVNSVLSILSLAEIT